MMQRSAERARILVVDDEPFSLEIASDVLGESYEVTAAESGQQAMEMLQRSGPPFDLVVLDRRMPEPGGMEILRHIRETPSLSRTPVIMQTAAADPVQVAEGIEAGADYYLTKPYRISALTRIVRAALRQHRETEDLRERATDLSAALRLLGEGVFRFRTLDEASALAHGVSMLCSAPDLVRVALLELLVNAVEHGNLGIGYDAKALMVQSGRWHEEITRRLADSAYRDRVASLTVRIRAEDITLRIEDQGAGFDPSRHLDMPDVNAAQLTGRGIALARKLAFPVLDYSDEGRCVEITTTPAPRFRD